MRTDIKSMSIEADDLILIKVSAHADAIEAASGTEAITGRVPMSIMKTGAVIDDGTSVVLTSRDGSMFAGYTVDVLDLSDYNDGILWVELT